MSQPWGPRARDHTPEPPVRAKGTRRRDVADDLGTVAAVLLVMAPPHLMDNRSRGMEVFAWSRLATPLAKDPTWIRAQTPMPCSVAKQAANRSISAPLA